MVKVLRAMPERRWSKRALLLVLTVVTAFGSLGGQRRQHATRRSASTIGSPACRRVRPTLNLMANTIVTTRQNGPFNAALIATDDPAFYNVTLKNFVAPWTNRDQAVFVPLNDYTATVIGMVRDDVTSATCCAATFSTRVSGVNPGLLDVEQRALRGRRSARRRSQGTAGRHRSAKQLDRRAVGGDRGRAHVARRSEGILHRRHEPRDVPLHDAQSHVPRHGTGARHVARPRSNPSGRIAQPGRRRARIPERLHRLPLAAWTRWRRRLPTTTSSTTRRPIPTPTQGSSSTTTSAPSIRSPARASLRKYFNNNTTFPYGYITMNDHWDNYWRHGPNACSAGIRRACRAPATAPSRWAWNSPTRKHSPSARSKKCSRTFACARRQTRLIAIRSSSMVSDFQSDGYNLRNVFAGPPCIAWATEAETINNEYHQSDSRLLARLALATCLALSTLFVAGCGSGSGAATVPIRSRRRRPSATTTARRRKRRTCSVSRSTSGTTSSRTTAAATCHNPSQAPRFVRNDDINLAYDAANTVVNLADPANSRMVLKVRGGHNCWLTSNDACGDIIQSYIEAWAGGALGGAG